MSRKLKIPNPFSLISNFVQKKEKEVIYEIEVEKPKKKKRNGAVDLDEEITQHGFEFHKSKNNFSSYKYVAIPNLFLFITHETSEISIFYDKKLLSKVNFIPNNRLFIEIFIKKTIENIK